MNAQVYVKRREKRLKQEDIAKILFISRNSYGAKERGEIPFTIPEARRLANYYGCTLDELFPVKKEVI